MSKEDFLFPLLLKHYSDFANYREHQDSGDARYKDMNKVVDKGVVDAKAFLIDPDDFLGLPEGGENGEHHIDLDLNKISLPFQSCYVQAYPKGSQPISLNDAELLCTLFVEVSPEWMFAVTLETDPEDGEPRVNVTGFDVLTPAPKDSFEHVLQVLLQNFCTTVMNSRVGLEKYNRQHPVKIGYHKQPVGVPHIIRLQSKNQSTEVMPCVAREIEWQHHWWCRGHWRRKSGGVGKDRHGNYTVNDFTWVVPHTKGNKEGVLVQSVYKA